MYKIFWGFIFIIFNFEINIDYISIGLLPDFVGYYLIMRGMWELQDEATYYKGSYKLVRIVAIYSAVIYCIDLFGIKQLFLHDFTGLTVIAFSLMGLVAFIYVTYVIMCGVQEMEDYYKEDMKGNQLETVWKCMTAMQVMCFIAIFIQGIVPQVYITSNIVACAIAVVFAVYLRKSTKIYEV